MTAFTLGLSAGYILTGTMVFVALLIGASAGLFTYALFGAGRRGDLMADAALREKRAAEAGLSVNDRIWMEEDPK